MQLMKIIDCQNLIKECCIVTESNCNKNFFWGGLLAVAVRT